MKNIPFAVKDFRTKRLRKKQISRLTKYHEQLREKHGVMMQSLTLSGPISKKDDLICRIRMIFSAVELTAKSHRGEILTMDPDTEEMYFPKDRPGFVPR